MLILVLLNKGDATMNWPTNFSAATIIGVINSGEMLLVLKLISVHQLFSVVPVLLCEITVITVFTGKTFEKTQITPCLVLSETNNYNICTNLVKLLN